MRRTRGFTLVEIAVVLVIAALMIALFAAMGSGLLAQQRRQTTVSRLAAIDAALVQYVMQKKRLPCPADGRVAPATAGAGTEINRDAVAGCTDQTNGVVPWSELGLAESDVVDGWGRRVTYRVAAVLAADNRMDMSQCDPAGGAGGAATSCAACTSTTIATCTPPANYLSGNGLTVKNTSGITLTNTGAIGPPVVANTAAAYVLISHGESGGGGYLSSGNIGESTTTDGTEEQKNYANLGPQAYYVDDQISDVAGASHFDDILLRPTILAVITRAGLGPRAH